MSIRTIVLYWFRSDCSVLVQVRMFQTSRSLTSCRPADTVGIRKPLKFDSGSKTKVCLLLLQYGFQPPPACCAILIMDDVQRLVIDALDLETELYVGNYWLVNKAWRAEITKKHSLLHDFYTTPRGWHVTVDIVAVAPCSTCSFPVMCGPECKGRVGHAHVYLQHSPKLQGRVCGLECKIFYDYGVWNVLVDNVEGSVGAIRRINAAARHQNKIVLLAFNSAKDLQIYIGSPSRCLGRLVCDDVLELF